MVDGVESAYGGHYKMCRNDLMGVSCYYTRSQDSHEVNMELSSFYDSFNIWFTVTGELILVWCSCFCYSASVHGSGGPTALFGF